jgi:hypothetical protein
MSSVLARKGIPVKYDETTTTNQVVAAVMAKRQHYPYIDAVRQTFDSCRQTNTGYVQLCVADGLS